MKIYLSGPITGVKDFKEKFEAAEEACRKQYPKAEIINPAKVNDSLPESTTWDEYMDFCYLMLDMADAVYMLPGWKMSTGACIEYGYTLAMDKRILNA